ncbi:hypothetical protein VDGD_04569 [Verticillium dahliae]|nr:V-type proton ATPase subunit G [Verticillium dahliae VDG1]RBQ86230.1 hypothetical protein VDGD_04569 [Verticillium dahliae]
MRFQVIAGLASIAILQPGASAIGTGPLVTHDDANHLHNPTHRRLPFLSWVRDVAVELFFGPYPSKTEIRHGVPTPKRYTDEVVLRFNLTAPEEEAAMAQSASTLFLDIWAFTEDFVDIRLRKDRIGTLLGVLPKSLRDSYLVLIPDVSAAIHGSRPSTPVVQHHEYMPWDEGSGLLRPQADSDTVFFRDYRPLSVIVPWMRLLEAMFPAIARMVNVGLSYEGRDIPALKVGVYKPGEPAPKRKTLLVTGGMHAREWISTTTVNYVAWSFVTSYGRDPMITKLLEHFDVVFVPVLNPDGVEYSWQVDRLWRKTRQGTDVSFCQGLDLDHAFGFEWDGAGSNGEPCSESYGGAKPWEAAEAVALANWARNETTNNNVEFVGLIDLHSYSQQVMYPFSYTCDTDPPNLENLEELAVGLAKAIRLSSGEAYSVTSACEGVVAGGGDMGRSSRVEVGGGSAIDWFYHEMRAHFSYQIKLRDMGSYGFLLPKENIVPTGEEMFNAMKYLGDYLLGNNGIERSNQQHSMTPPAGGVFSNPELRRVKRR